MRKEIDWTGGQGRDAGKTFHLREMAAIPGGKWAARALLALARSGVDLPPGALGMGWAGIAIAGVGKLINLRWEDAEPLMDEVMACVSYKTATQPPMIRSLTPDDVEEIETYFRLQYEVLQLHVNFSLADVFRKLTTPPKAPADTQNTSTSTPPSQPSS